MPRFLPDAQELDAVIGVRVAGRRAGPMVATILVNRTFLVCSGVIVR